MHRRNVPAVAEVTPDAALLARIRAGDDRALAMIYDRHAGLVYGLARRVTCDDHLAEDVTQEVFAYLWELPDRVDLTRGSLRAYLAVVTHRRAVDEVRRCERRNRIESAHAGGEDEDGPEEDVVDALARQWGCQRLAAVFDQLPDERRAAIGLAYYQGQTYSQVARTLAFRRAPRSHGCASRWPGCASCSATKCGRRSRW